MPVADPPPTIVLRFHQCLFGHEFTIQSDHKPLEGLFKETKGIPMIQRWALSLSAYDYHIITGLPTLTIIIVVSLKILDLTSRSHYSISKSHYFFADNDMAI